MFKYISSSLLAIILSFVFIFDIGLTNHGIGNLFVAGIMGCLVLFLLFKFGVHYKIQGLNRFASAFYYSVFEYKKAQVKPSEMTYMDSVREQAEVALAANFDPTLTTADLKIPTTLYSGKDPFLKRLRAKIQKAEKIKLEARHLDRKANVLLGKTQEELVEKDLADKTPAGLLDQMFDIESGVAAIIDLTVAEIKHQGYDRAPDYEIITHIALDDNPFFSRTFQFFDSEDVVGVLFRAPFMIILLGIIGTFAGFYLALNEGGDIKSGASVAIVSSLVGLPVSLLMDYINTLFPDESRYQQAFDKFKQTLEMLFNHEQELDTEQTEGVAAQLRKENELALATAEQERVDALAKQEAELDKQRQLELTKTEQELRKQAEGETAKLKEEKKLALAEAEQERVDALAKQEAELGKQRQLELTKTEQELRKQAEGEAAKLKEEKEQALAKAEQERVDALAKQEADLDKQKQVEVAKTEQKLKEHAEREAANLKKEHKHLAKLEQERVDALAKKEQAEGETAKVKKEKEQALAKAEQERVDALAKKEAELDKQKQLEVAKTEQKLKELAEREAANLKKEKELLAKAEQAAGETAKLKKEKEQAIAEAEQERVDALAKQEAELEKQKQLEVAKTEQKLKEQAESEAAKLKKEKEHALAEAALEHKGDLAAQKSELEEEKTKALSEKDKVFTKKLALQKRLLAEAAEDL